MSPLGAYLKCYSTLTNSRPRSSDDLYQQVLSGEVTPANACVQLITESEFNGQGVIKVNSDRHRRILHTLHSFHQSWFGKLDFLSSFAAGVRGTYSSYIYDQSEPALYITRALFQPNQKYEDIVTSNQSLKPVRFMSGTLKSSATRQETIDLGLCRASDSPATCYFDVSMGGARAPWAQVRYSPKGDLVGIQAANPLIVPQLNAKGEKLKDVNIVANIGGGIIGSPIYRMVNQPLAINGHFDGSTVARNWSKALFQDLLCRSLPVLRYGDALPFVDATSSFPFRQSQTCVTCHATIDRMAGTMRNYTLRFAGRATTTVDEKILAIEYADAWPISKPPIENWRSEIDTDYHLRPPIGQLYYRGYDGTLNFSSVSGSGELGSELAARKDLYVCAAKRYYEFFTGHSVTVADINDPAYIEPLPPEEIHHRNRVIELGERLFQHQSLKILIREIIESPEFNEVPIVLDRGLASEES
ncbi:MAG: hypothetical protein KDD61_04155 [Bdellovibrionales bacterium]|nr:hypothetical protein [Bdellovibrionales bacterium]